MEPLPHPAADASTAQRAYDTLVTPLQASLDAGVSPVFRVHHAGRITEPEVIAQIWALLLGGIGVAYGLDTWVGHEFPTLTVG